MNSVVVSGIPTIMVRIYYSSYHLWAAEHFYQLAGEIEDAHEGRSRFDIKHRAYVTNTILSSVAFLEAAINEVFQDAFDNYLIYIGSLSVETRKILADFWDMTEADNKSFVSILDKYQLALRFAGMEPFNKGENPYQDANLVVKIRNTLIHYKPQLLGGENIHQLEAKLKGKFPENKLMSGSAGNPYFPDKALGKGCAEWTVKSVLIFANGFFLRMGVIPHYKKVEFTKPIAEKLPRDKLIVHFIFSLSFVALSFSYPKFG
ncbi:MAG: hypothetical protein HYW01_14235 [Deltaproteobacteria bacterium]|nr:hypothetical protein [Deltaproteobacteria bacterium]